MSITKYLIICCLGMSGLASAQVLRAEPFRAGFIYDDFELTLAPGHRQEILGPFFYNEQKETQHHVGLPGFDPRPHRGPDPRIRGIRLSLSRFLP